MAISKSPRQQRVREPSKRPPPKWALDLLRIAETIDPRELEKLPRDLVENFDHYAHGSPRQD